jgi:large repetitive protein
MYKWQPSKWIKWAPVMAGLPFLAGGWLQTGDLVSDVTARAQAAAGDWAKVETDGRDVKLSGNVTGQVALDAAVKAVADTYGVRTVDVTNVKIVEPVALAAPTVDSLTTNNTTPIISGTWPQDVAKTLAVTLNDKTYNLGTDAELTSEAGKWTLKPAAAIADGEYNVTASVSDGGKMMTAATSPAKLIIDTVAPVVPTLTAPAADAKWPYAISGSWPEAIGSGLAVKLADKTYTLGTDEALKSDGKGTYTFAPAVDLKPGSYDLNFTVTDAAGNLTPLAVPAAIVIPEVKAAEAAPAAPVLETLAAPVVNPVAADTVWPYAISGTWPEGPAKSLAITLDGKTYELGSKDLISDGKGKFLFLPSSDLKPGSYDLAFNLTDAANKVTTNVVKAAIVIAPPPPPAPAAPKPEPVKLVAPTIEKMSSDKDAFVVKGTWNAGVAKSLSVSLAGQTYKLGTDYALLSDASGHWTLKPAKPLANGIYDVVVEVGDGAGATLKDVTVGELEINVPPPPKPAPAPVPAVKPAPAPVPMAAMIAPTVEASTSDSDHPQIKGTWNAGVAKTLSVYLDGIAYKLGTNFELLSNAAGQWTLKPTKPLVNGNYEVIAVEGDDAGTSVRDKTHDELTVNVAPPPPAPPAAQAYDCEATLARISAVFPVRFAFNKDNVAAPFDLSVNQYAALLKDPRCVGLKVEVEGHADYLGSEKYNQGLSERRAANVITALTAGGIDAGRLTAKGFSKDRPLDPATNDTARAKNRRVEFTISK